MHNRELAALFDDLSTPLIVDACLRMGTELRAAAARESMSDTRSDMAQ